MTLTTIFVVRHGFRSNWTTDPKTGHTNSAIPSPTGIDSDPALSGYGVHQSHQLATLASSLDPPIVSIISSPFYRCVQTIQPFAAALDPGVPLLIDRGLGEWYGTSRFSHPSAASLALLQTFFPSAQEQMSIVPSVHGESMAELHDRCAYAMARIIEHCDTVEAEGSVPKSIVICTHAAVMIALGRALTGKMPLDGDEVDFHTYTCSITKFGRRKMDQGRLEKDLETWRAGDAVPTMDWKGGRGVGGGWDCLVNAETEHLSNGGERDWHFSGEENFSTSEPSDVQKATAEPFKGDAIEKESRRRNAEPPKL